MPLTVPTDNCAGQETVGVYGIGGAVERRHSRDGGTKVAGADAAQALGIDWTAHQPSLSQAIPPAYTEYLGRQALRFLSYCVTVWV